MKRYNRRNFTLVELMFVVGILVILIGISWVAGTKVLRKQAKSKTKAEITMLVAAVKQYKDRFGSLPVTSASARDLDFGQYLSKVLPGSGWTGKRPMFIDFKKHNINISNDNFDDANATSGTVQDPYEQNYMYQAIDSDSDGTAETFKIWSVGLDGGDDNGADDDISSDNLQN